MTGRPLSVHPDDILGAGRTIEMAGQRVTGTRLRKIVGRGRPDVLIRVWQTAREADMILPPELKAEVDALGSDVIRGIVRLIGKASHAQVEALAARVREADAQRLEAETLLGDATAELEGRITTLECALADRQRTIDALQAERARWMDTEALARQITDQLRCRLAAEPQGDDDAVANIKTRMRDVEKRLDGLTPAATTERPPTKKARRPPSEAGLGLFDPLPDRPSP